MERDYARAMIWSLTEMTGGPFPPTFLKIVMRDGAHYYVHSGNQRDVKSDSVAVNVYDFRAMSDEDNRELTQTLKTTTTIPSDPSKLHPRLLAGILRCRLDDVLYVVQWERHRPPDLEQRFPRASKGNWGFSLPANKV